MVQPRPGRPRFPRSVIFLVTLLGSLALLGIYQAPLAYAAPRDLTCQQVDQGVTCSQFLDASGYSIWCDSYNNSSVLHNSYTQICVRSLVFAGTGDGERYAAFNIQQVNNPDTANTVQDYWDSSADSSQSGSYSTMETRLWSLERNTSCTGHTNCDQENYEGLEPTNNCDPNGGSTSIGLSGSLGQGGFSWSETDPLFYGCTLVAPSDLYSQYYDYTLMQSSFNATKLKEDFTFGQWSQNGYNNRWFGIGLSAKGHFNHNYTYSWISSGNIDDYYHY